MSVIISIALFFDGDKTRTTPGSEAEENELARCLITEIKTSKTDYEYT
jgi:hypothetical protein